MIEALIFYSFSAVSLIAAGSVISARNPVHAVLFLILTFFSTAGLFVLLGAEFLAMVLVVVYVGAVAVLFLFVVMLLDIDLLKIREGFLQYLPLGSLIGLVLLIELSMIFMSWHLHPEAPLSVGSRTPDVNQISNTEAIGRLLYTDNIFLFQMSGLILLVAMIGTILLAHRDRPGVRRQSIYNQNSRNKENSVEIRKVASGEGI